MKWMWTPSVQTMVTNSFFRRHIIDHLVGRMGIAVLVVLAYLAPSMALAQEDQLSGKKEQWTYAIGTTFYEGVIGKTANENNGYSMATERLPFIFNFKYRLRDRHLLNAEIALDLGGMKPGAGSSIFHRESLEEEMKSILQRKSFHFSNDYVRRRTLVSGSIGYEYCLPVIWNISVSGGIDLTVTYVKHTNKILHHELTTGSNMQLEGVLRQQFFHDDVQFISRPYVSLSYDFRRLRFELYGGYTSSLYTSTFRDKDSSSAPVIKGIPPTVIINRWNEHYFLYKLRVYYTF